MEVLTMDGLMHYHVESGFTETGPALTVRCGERGEMLDYLEGCDQLVRSHAQPTGAEGKMKGTVKGQAFKFLFVGNAVTVNGYDYTEVRSCTGTGCAKL
jgi:hypothetical protein